MRMSRHWAMPSKNTFQIKPVMDFIGRYNGIEIISIDPFANKSKIAKITNDIDPQYCTDYCMDAVDFLKTFDDESIDLVYYDPPYSARQISEVYTRLEKTVNMETTQSSFFTKAKKEIARIIKPGGYVLSFAWHSGGVGKKLGFDIQEILLINHGGAHNDTICVAEIKLPNLFSHLKNYNHD